MEKKYNMRSPAVKRLMREAIELRDPTPMYFAQPMEENLFEWHFTIQGPQGTPFEKGRYHGRILLPSEYPMKPPNIILMTPNGRFELHQKICVSASAYHPELWQPSWSIRTVLLAIIGFMPTEGVGAIGSMDCPPEVRRQMALRSLDWTCPMCGIPNRDILPTAEESSSQEQAMAEAADIVSKMAFKSEAEVKQQKELLAREKPQKDAPSEESALEESGADSRPLTSGTSSAPATATATPTLPVNSDPQPRQRVLPAPPRPSPPQVVALPPSAKSRPGPISLVLMWLLVLAIGVLAVRRVYCVYW